MRHQCFAVCAPGLEHLVADELVGLGIRRSHTITGGVTFDATSRQLYAANVWSRTATRILVRINRFRARDFAQLELGAAAIDWDAWLPRGRDLTFRVSSARSRLYHTAAIEQRLRRVLHAEDDSRGGEDDGQLVVVRLADDHVTISIDASGHPLYKRGWRLASSKAPLRETLAASMVLAAGWQPDLPLVDPFAGSGTIAIEAALIAAGRAPGAQRAFAFQDWPSFEPGTFASVRATVEGDADRAHAPIIARDRDAGAVESTIANAERAGVASRIDARQASISELGDGADAYDNAGWIVTNPPYGKRVSKNDDLRDLFARFGNVARESFDGWNVGLLAADARAVGHAGLRLEERFHTRNGGIPVSYVTGRVSPRPAPSGPRRGHRRQGP
jgi:putative N6-adenine-specific DNA methylase